MSCSGNNCSSTDYNQEKTTFQTQGGRFSLCSIVWDSENGRFKNSNETEKEFCCLSSCKSSTQACLDTCKNIKGTQKQYVDCGNGCARNIILCQDLCAQSTPGLWRGDSPLIKCVEQNGFGKYPNYDIDAIKDNKELLVDCCHADCIPTSEVACIDHCKNKYADLIGESKDPLLQVYNDFKAEGSPVDALPAGDNSWIYYLITVGVVGVLIIIFLVIMKYKKVK